MNTGESFDFNFAHRGRGGPDRAQFQIGAANVVVMDVTTDTAGMGTINAGGASTGNSAVGIAGGWTRYTGNYDYLGASGIQPLGFAAISSGSGGLGLGNLLDDINISLKPYVEFIGNAGSSVEGNAYAPPRVKVVGRVPVGGLVLRMDVSGSAVFGTKFDYGGTTTLAAVTGNSNSINMTVPAGNFSDASANNVF